MFTCIWNVPDYEYAFRIIGLDFIRSTGHRYCSASILKLYNISKFAPALPFLFHSHRIVPHQFNRKTNKF